VVKPLGYESALKRKRAIYKEFGFVVKVTTVAVIERIKTE